MAFDLRVEHRIGGRTIAVAFASEGGLTALFGPSGSGKTSILNMVAGLLRPDKGHITAGDTVLFDSAAGIDIAARHRRSGYVFQDNRLFPHLRVRDNLLYGWRAAPTGERSIDVDEASRFLGIGHLLDRWPRTLSGGEAQRVAIGRALLSGPRFLLLDEPLAALDAARRDGIITVIERIRADLALPMILVSHSAADVARLADQVVTIEPLSD